MAEVKRILTPKFRVAFPHVFVAHKAPGNDEAKFSVCMVFPKETDLSQIKALLTEAAQAKFGATLPPGLKQPIRDGAIKAHLDGFGPEVTFINASTMQQPGVVDQNVQAIISPTEFYGGCYARAMVNAFAWDNPRGGKGVSLGLQNLQKLADGPAFSKRTKAEDDFDAVATEPGAAAAPPAGGDGVAGDPLLG